MHVLYQANIWRESSYDRLMNSMQDSGRFTLMETHVIPFTETLDPEPVVEPQFVLGSNRFVNICRQRGYPVFQSFPPHPIFYDDHHWLNRGRTMTWGELKKASFDEPIFAKPYTEKFFTGRVISSVADMEKVQLATSFIGDEDGECILVSAPVTLVQEARFFVIDGTIVTGSLYRDRGNVRYVRLGQESNSWQRLERILDSRFVDEAFVIDLGLTEHGWKIVEMNNINSAGIYDCDTSAIASALYGWRLSGRGTGTAGSEHQVVI